MSVIFQLVGSQDDSWRQLPIEFDSPAALQELPFRLFQAGKGSETMMLLLVPPSTTAFVNGEPLLGGIHVLAHRDELLVAGRRYCYSAISKPEVSVFALAAGARRPRCVVCRFALEDGQAVVFCPGCGRAFHQMEAQGDRPEKKCFSFRPQCLCGHPTSLDGAAQWHPLHEESPYE
jgi:hypothetical protein